MNEIKRIIDEFVNNQSISLRKLELILYLYDWYSCLKNGVKRTDIEWEYEHGSIKSNLKDVLLRSCLGAQFTIRIYSELSKLGTVSYVEIGTSENTAEFDNVLYYLSQKLKHALFNDIVHLVESSYPLNSPTIYKKLNLHLLASEFRKTIKPA